MKIADISKITVITKGNSPYSFFVHITSFKTFPKIYIIKMSTFLGNTISKTISAPATATKDALAEKLQSVSETASLSYSKMMDDIGCGQERLKDNKQDDDEQYDTVPITKLLFGGKRVKEFRVTGNLNGVNTRNIMAYSNYHTLR